MGKAIHLHLYRTADFMAAELETRPVYAHMPLTALSQIALRAWATRRGVRYAEPNMHVTTAYSKKPVKVPRSYKTRDSAEGLVVQPGGRSIAKFGNQLVLLLECPALHARWQAWRDRGATWDYPTYQPHVTFADLKHNDGTAIDISGPAFDEPLVLTQEVVESPRTDY